MIDLTRPFPCFTPIPTTSHFTNPPPLSKGNGIRLIVLPDMLKHAACVKKISKQAASAVSSSVDNAGGKRKRE